MTITRDQVLAAIELEARLAEILETEAKAGIYAQIKHAQEGWEAAQARHGALVQVLDIIDTRGGRTS